MLENPLKSKNVAVLLGLTLALSALSMAPTASAACTAGDNVAGIQYAVLPCRGGLCYVEDTTCEDVIQAVWDQLP